MKILVLGGTGAMGRYLVPLLAASATEVVVTTRKSIKSDGNVKYLQGDAQDINFLVELLKQHWSCIIDFMVYSTPTFDERVNWLLGATDQYVFLSSARVYANAGRNLLTEESHRLLDVSRDKDYLATDEYALSKARQENILFNARESNWTILRPYITFGPQRLQLGVLEKEDWLYRALKGRTIVFSKEMMSKKTTMTCGFDVASRIVSIVGNKDSLGEAIHLVAGTGATWAEVLGIYLDILESKLGARPKVILQDYESFITWKPSRYQIIYDRFFDRLFDLSKAERICKKSSFSDLRESLEACLTDFIRDKQFGSINWRCEAKKDRASGEVTPLEEIKGGKQKLKYLLFRFLIK